MPSVEVIQREEWALSSRNAAPCWAVRYGVRNLWGGEGLELRGPDVSGLLTGAGEEGQPPSPLRPHNAWVPAPRRRRELRGKMTRFPGHPLVAFGVTRLRLIDLGSEVCRFTR